MFAPDHYTARAKELEEAARGVRSHAIRKTYLDVAASYRSLAILSDAASLPDDDKAVQQLAERMVGRAPR